MTTEPKDVRQTIRFRPVDQGRIDAIAEKLKEDAPPEALIDRQAVLWAALRLACVHLGIEQRTDVEPHDRPDTIPPGASS